MIDHKKIPWWIKRGVSNPMKNRLTVEKMISSMKRNFQREGYVSPNKGRSRPDLVGKPLSEETKEKLRIKMLENKNNPMKDPLVVEKSRRTFHNTMLEKGYIHPNKGKERPDARLRMESDLNPMKNPETAKLVWEKGKKTLLEKGGISKGQNKLYKLLIKLGISFEKEKCFSFNETGFKYCHADAYLNKENIVIEYDGFIGHYTEEGLKRDDLRDQYLKNLYGIVVLRLSTNTVFADGFIETLRRNIDELSMEENRSHRRIGDYRSGL